MLDNKKSFEILNIWKRKEIREKFESWKKKKKNSITIMLLVFTGRKQTHTDSFPLKLFLALDPIRRWKERERERQMKGIEARLNKPKFKDGRAANVTDLRLTK